MNDNPVNLSNCDLEPIRVPGRIQSHGLLIAVDTHFAIQYHSDNTSMVPGLPANLIGMNLGDIEDVFNSGRPFCEVKVLVNNIFQKVSERNNPVSITLDGRPFNLILSASGPYCLLEIEEDVTRSGQDISSTIGRSISEMLVDRNLGHLLDNTAQQVKSIIGFDRIMIYRFANDGHGEVVAESKNEALPALLGLHYPASDIPRQARELYKLNLTRFIANVQAAPSRIIASPGQEDALDLTYAQLRAVSPIHIQYLKNMKVESSFSISIICHGELWGLIACHNYSPKFINYQSRESAGMIGQIFSSALEFRQDQHNHEVFGQYKTGVDALSKNLQKSKSLQAALITSEVNLMNAVDATGAVLIYENQISRIGKTPNDQQLYELVDWIKNNVSQTLYHTNQLSQAYPEAADFKDVGCGILISVLSKEDVSYLLWFKPELIQTINWAGDPSKPVVMGDNMLHIISPRNSFEIWSESVAGASAPWNSEELRSVTRLREEILFVINQKAADLIALNDKLKLAYEELDIFSHTIAHDLKNPLSAVMGYAQLLQMEDNPPDASHSIDRIIAAGGRMSQMITEILEHSKAGQTELNLCNVNVRPIIDEFIVDLAIAYDPGRVVFTIGELPLIQGDPIMIYQVFANLLGNAVKYSRGSDVIRISVTATVQGPEIVFRIADNGQGIDHGQEHKIFELFHRANNVGTTEGSGVGLAIVRKIMDRHGGKIQVTSTLGTGTTFLLYFKGNDIGHQQAASTYSNFQGSK